MSDDENWILEVMSPAEATSMNVDGQIIADEIIPGITMYLTITNVMAAEMCKTYKNAIFGDTGSWMQLTAFLQKIVATLETHLNEEGINPYN